MAKSFNEIKPQVKNPTQLAYLKAIKKSQITFAVGPAGTGKTYLAAQAANNYLNKKEVLKVILVRPIIEAGEHLGFLPGDFQEKINPYLYPLYDAFTEHMSAVDFDYKCRQGVIESTALAYMRGRTFNDAFVILDEAQNTTIEQMKMFLTRIGRNCKMVITGDMSQIDLPKNVDSGLIYVTNRLHNIQDISIIEFNNEDIVRNSLITDILEALK